MSGTGSDSGWLEAAIAWEVCASLHRQYCKGKDALFTTRQSDFVKHAENARGRAHPAQEARVPLSDGQIEQGHDAADIAPTDATIGTFNDGVRFAEKHHGITAAQAAPAMDAKQLGDAVVKWLGCETTKPRGDTGEPERRIDVSVERLGFAVAAVLKTVTAPAPVAEDADPHRTDAEIVAQTIALTKFLLSWKWGLEPEGDMSRVWESKNTKAVICWNAACHIQDLLTQTDVLNAVVELDGAQAAQPEGGANANR